MNVRLFLVFGTLTSSLLSFAAEPALYAKCSGRGKTLGALVLNLGVLENKTSVFTLETNTLYGKVYGTKNFFVSRAAHPTYSLHSQFFVRNFSTLSGVNVELPSLQKSIDGWVTVNVQAKTARAVLRDLGKETQDDVALRCEITNGRFPKS